MLTAVALATGASALAASNASAGGLPVKPLFKPIEVSPMSPLDALATSSVSPEHRDKLPTVSRQLAGLNQLNGLSKLHQITDLAAPVMGLLPAVE